MSRENPNICKHIGCNWGNGRIERRIAIQNRNLDHHENKWGSITGAEQEGGVTII